VCRNPAIVKQVLKNAPDSVHKSLCNIALNAAKGDISFTQSQKRLFRKHRALILKLADKKVPLAQKRRAVQQSGSGFFIPALIGGVLSLLGSSVINKFTGGS
jgi:hypothetical protein